MNPHTIYLHLTGRCNLKCVYCYFSGYDEKKEELSTPQWLTILKDINRLMPPRVVFTGGEPLLRDDIIQLAKFYRSLGPRRNHDGENSNRPFASCENPDKITLAVNTNGFHISRRNVDDLIENFDEIRISIDSFQETNDSLRGKGSYEAAIRALGLVKYQGGNPSAFITVTWKNIGSLYEFMGHLYKAGIFRIHLSPLNMPGPDGLYCDPAHIVREAGRFWRDEFGLELESVGMNEPNCGMGKYLTIYPDGAIYPCHMTAFPELELGNTRRDSLFRIFHNSPMLKRLSSLDLREKTIQYPGHPTYNGIPDCPSCIENIRSTIL